MLEKAVAIKRLEYSLLNEELKKETTVAEKQYQSFDEVFNHHEKGEPVKIKKEISLRTDKSSLFYNSKYSFIEFKNVGKYLDDCCLALFKQPLEEFKKFTHEKVKTKEKKKIVNHNAIKIYNTLLSIYFDDYNNVTDGEKEKMGEKDNPYDFLIKVYGFIESKKEDEEKSKS